jgi:hypothetical protein
VVFKRMPGLLEECPYRILSNVVSDGNFFYWVDNDGLQRLSKDASTFNPVPDLLLPQLGGGGLFELLIDDGILYGLHLRPILVGTSSLWSMPLGDPAGYSIIATDTGAATNLRWDGTYLYAIWGYNNELRRHNLTDGSHLLIAYGVTSYLPTGQKFTCTVTGCTYYDYTFFIDRYNPHLLTRYDAETGAYFTLYTATPQPGKVASLYGLTDGYNTGFNLLDRDLFFFERQEVPGSGTASDTLLRKIPGKAPAPIYYRTGSSIYRPEQLQRSKDFVLWKEITTPNANDYGEVYRLPLDAMALPVVNLRIAGYELTQGVHSAVDPLYVQRRPTFFRLFVKSDGLDVPNVTARLTGYSGGASLGTILPSPLLITVPETVVKTNLAKQFIFELPLDWTTKSDLTLVPTLNPFGFPLEPTYSDNSPAAPYGPFAFLPQPGLRLTLVSAGFSYGGKTYAATDDGAIRSWLFRAYPTGLGAVEHFGYNDDELGRRVMDYNSYEPCQHLNRTADGGRDNRNLCASYYLHERMAALRRAGTFRMDTYIYVSVPKMARGSASPTDPVANGPDLTLNGFTFEQAGVYAGHEIGHLLKRNHPVPSASDCGHSASDPDYPYIFTWIGDSSHKTTAFDSGLMTLTKKRSASLYFEKNDMMGYCNLSQQWLSDYTYDAIYLYARQFPGPPPPTRAIQASDGDWLTIGGSIAIDGSAAAFSTLWRSSSMAELQLQVPGAYSLRLLDGSGAELSSHAFTPLVSEDAIDWMNFIETVPFAAGTRRLQVVANSNGSILAEKSVSANSPVVSNLDLPGASLPLEGTVKLAWQASDPDGDTLTFDVQYSANGGDFRLLSSGLSATSYTLDTADLSGGNGIFRVIASDGVNTAQADSASIPVVMKAPTVHIVSPGEGFQIQYGQPINLFGYAQDPQDGMLEDISNLLWSGPEGPIDVGPMVGLAGMDAAGMVEITLQATNSMGLTAEKTVQVVIGDEIGNPPPSLYVASAGVAFQVANGVNSSQTTDVGIWNAGGPGTIEWEASLSPGVDWLQVNTLSGSAPYTLTLSANPTDLAADTIYQTTLTINGSDGTTTSVPVSLQMGAGFKVDGIINTFDRKVYLPAVSRQ